MKNLLLICSLCILTTSNMQAQHLLIWADVTNKAIKTSFVDGSNITSIASTQTSLRRVRVDHINQRIYWTEGGSGKIKAVDFDGSNVTDILNASSNIAMVAIDATNNRIFYTETGTGLIMSSNTDGTNIQTVVSGTASVQGLAIDLINNHLYWAEFDAMTIKRVDLDGSNQVTVLATGTAIIDMHLDIPNGHIYFSERTNNKIQRVNFDGTNLIDLITTNDVKGAFAIDLNLSAIYWVGEGNNGFINKANLDGSNQSNVILATGATLAGFDMHFDPTLVSIEESKNRSFDVELYPNPGYDKVKISASPFEKFDLKIYNMSGTLVRENLNVNSETEVDINGLHAGVYAVYLYNYQKGAVTKKLIKY
ncbi:MAG: T9SS type A sorting domain-containing protein [Flavobacteriales bacterium]|nr:T9SS type A sorting domain-containing protein [Flavobacteriales bacterium]